MKFSTINYNSIFEKKNINPPDVCFVTLLSTNCLPRAKISVHAVEGRLQIMSSIPIEIK